MMDITLIPLTSCGCVPSYGNNPDPAARLGDEIRIEQQAPSPAGIE
jgi:hypothetical protein